MKRAIVVFGIICACICGTYADNIIRLRCGATFREVPKERCFADSRTKTIDEVTYTYGIFKSNNDRSGMFEGSNGEFEAPIGLKIKKADFPSKKENISIPPSIDGVPIVEIGFACFEKRSRLKSITLPNTVISIEGGGGSLGGGAFEGCTSLETIIVPSTLVNVGSRAFKGCRRLKTNFVFDKDVDIGDEAFYGCHEITSIRFKKGINSFQGPHRVQRDDFNVIKSGTFADCRRLSDFELPTTTRIIGFMASGGVGAFSNCCSLAHVTLPKSLEGIGVNAFADCKALTDVVVPLRMNKILYNAFKGCTGLKSVTLPATLKEIPSSMFEGCTALEAIKIPNGVTEIEDGAFRGCSSLSNVSIPDHVTELGVGCFEGCTSLKTVKLPLHLDNIKGSAFEGCSSLEALQLPPNVTSIGGGAFEGCRKLASIDIPNRVGSMGIHTFGSIGNYAFRGCDSLKSLRLNDGCNCYPDSLAGMVGLEEVDIPASLEAAQAQGSHAEPKEYRLNFGAYFKDSINLVKVNVRNMVNPKCPGTLKAIGGFNGFKKLKTVKLPEGLEDIDGSAFEDCVSLSEISLPSSVKYIRSGAFAGCVLLKKINLPAGVNIERGAFNGCPAYTDPRDEAERNAREAREAAEREKAAKEAAERRAREREREVREKEREKRVEAEREKELKKWREEEARREKANSEREKSLEELNKRLSGINEDVPSKINDVQSGGSGSFILLLLMVAGAAGGIFVYSKKKGCTYLVGFKEIVIKAIAVISAMIANAKNRGVVDRGGEDIR